MTYLIAPLLLILLYLFMILPALPIRRASDHLALHTHYAHRGYHDRSDRPENSLAAFRAACELGYGIELDIHLTADGQIVVFHDDTAERMCGDPRRISDCTYEELSLLRLKDSNESIPLFSDVLSLVDGQVPLLI